MKEFLKSAAIDAVNSFFKTLEASLAGKPLRLMFVKQAHEWALQKINELFD